jgi:hypothetical protein
MATYAHEWTHYFQLLGTSLGNYAAELETNAWLMKHYLLVQVAIAARGKLTFPVMRMLERDDRLCEVPRVAEAVEAIEELCRARNHLYCSWVIDEKEDFDLGKIRTRRPFSLNAEQGTLRFASEDGRIIDLRISGLQLLEHAARCSEAIIHGGTLTSDLLRPQALDYHGLFLFLYQEGHIDFRSGDGIFQIVLPGMESLPSKEAAASTLLTWSFLFTCFQVALMLYLDPKVHQESTKRSQDRPWVQEEFCKACVLSSSRAICRLLSIFGVAREFLHDSSKGAKDNLESLDRLCGTAELPSYSRMVKYQTERANRAVKEAGTRFRFNNAELEKMSSRWSLDGYQRGIIQDLPNTYSEYFFGRSAEVFAALCDNRNLTTNPVFNCDGVPCPWVLVYSESGERRLNFPFPWQKTAKLTDTPRNMISHFQEQSMLVEKMLFDEDLACYRANDLDVARFSRASFNCPVFDDCFNRAKDTVLGFCAHSEWIKTASTSATMLTELGVKK